MTINDKINTVKILLADDSVDDDIITGYLSVAEKTIGVNRYPFLRENNYEIEPQYDMLQCELAARYYVRRGGLGEIIHNENSINRTWYSSDDRELLSRVTPVARLV